MLRTKLVLIIFTLYINYCIYGFVTIPIMKKYKVIKINQNKPISLNLFNSTNNFSNKIFENIDEKLLLLLKTFSDVLLLYINIFNIFYIIYIIKHM